MTDSLLSLLMIAAAGALAVVVSLIRSDRLPRGAILFVTLLCGGGLLTMILTDWPLENLAKFWADHSVLAGVLSSLLLIALVFLVYERTEQKRQDELAEGLSGAGAGGIVDHIIDVEVALALLSAVGNPAMVEPLHWAKWKEPGKPLRWLREGRGEILNSPAEPDRDPRSLSVSSDRPLAPWGQELVDQAMRRLLAAMRDWASLVGASKDGTAALLLLSKIRVDLMKLHDLYPREVADQPSKDDRRQAALLVARLRTRLRILARSFEHWSGADRPRRELLDDASPLPPVWPGFDGAGRTLTKRLRDAATELRIDEPLTTVDQAREFAKIAHVGQVDKLDRDYFDWHLLPVAQKLKQYGPDAEMAGLLHDILEDTSVTAEQLRDLGVPKSVVKAVDAVTKRNGEPYADLIKRSAADKLGRLVKLADNELNLESNDALAALAPEKAARLKAKYEAAREVLLRS